MEKTNEEVGRKIQLEGEIAIEVKDILSIEGVDSLNLNEIHQKLIKRGYDIDPDCLREYLDWEADFQESQIQKIKGRYSVYGK